jgi:cellulose biosynthesis protein BcsQ
MKIRQDVKLSYAAAGKKSIWEYDAAAPAAEDYRALAEWVRADSKPADSELLRTP